MSETITKGFEIKAATLAENVIEGAAAVMGNMDRGGDVIFPGAFKKALPAFKESGFVAEGHDWRSYIAMPLDAKEKGTELWTRAEFHSTADAQAVRQKCMERIQKGLSIGLSIGFSVDYSDDDSRKWFQSGDDLWKHIEESADPSFFDKKSIRAWKGSCRAIKQVAELYEYSVVPVPMNPKATATMVKRFGLDNCELNSLSFDDHSETVLTAVRGLVARQQDYKSMRDEKGRPLSDARRAEIGQLKSLIDQLLTTDDGASHHDLRARATAKLRSLRAATG